MTKTPSYEFAIVGAGIVGLAHAALLAKAGKKVAVFEREPRAVGASIRNFGMVWPIGQPPGEMRRIALRSRELWLQTLNAAGIWHRRCGSLHLAYHEDELEVLREFARIAPDYAYTCEMISAKDVGRRSPVVRQLGLLGALWSPDEVCVFPRGVVWRLPDYLRGQGVDMYFGHAVIRAESGRLEAGGQEFAADRILVCSGDDFMTLFPEVYAASGMTRCKLQMMRARPKDTAFEIGPHLCAGLTLGHYANFRICKALPPVVERHRRELPFHAEWGIHLLVSQHEDGCLTIGDSHEYGMSVDPFLRQDIDAAILSYLDTFLPVDQLEIIERWHGVYAKHPDKGLIVEDPVPGVTIVTGVGGAGMTLSFGVAEHVLTGLNGL